MSPIARFSALALLASILLTARPDIAGAQRRAVPRHPPHPERAVVVRGHVFIGGYFYDPFYGPYPWWPRATYPYWYFPVYDSRADVRLRVEPEEAENAAVYVDGFYAGIIDDFNGVFQALPLTPGGHSIVLYLEGYRTVRHNIYLRPASSFTLRATMERLPVSVKSEPPELAPPVPAPPAGTYQTPVTPPATPLPQPAPRRSEAVGFGTLDLYVQPATAEVTIDGKRWLTSDEGHFMVQVPTGKHRVEVSKSGYRQFTAEVEIREGEATPLNVSLLTMPCYRRRFGWKRSTARVATAVDDNPPPNAGISSSSASANSGWFAGAQPHICRASHPKAAAITIARLSGGR